jgi:hypothetical protein
MVHLHSDFRIGILTEVPNSGMNHARLLRHSLQGKGLKTEHWTMESATLLSPPKMKMK